jgi:hypothetical protein
MVSVVLTCIAVVIAAVHLSGATSVDDLAPSVGTTVEATVPMAPPEGGGI